VGTAELHRVTDAESLVRGKAILAELHRDRWQAEGRIGVFDKPRFAAFHDVFMRCLFEEGTLRLYWLTVRGEPVEVHYSFLFRNRLYYYQTGRRMSISSHQSLGPVLLARTLQELAPRECTAVEFLAGICQYKRQFTHKERPLVELTVAPFGPREGLRRLLRWGWRLARNCCTRPSTGVNKSEHSSLRESPTVNALPTWASGAPPEAAMDVPQLDEKTRVCGESTKIDERE
jgi:hypothetical protein